MALTLKEYRSKYPQYDEIDDEKLARSLHEKYYSNIDWDEFSSKIQYTPVAAEPDPVVDEPVDSANKIFQTVQKFKDGTLPSFSGGALGLGRRKATQEEIAEDVGSLQRRLIDLEIAKPDDYEYSEEEYDAIMGDRIQKEILSRTQSQSPESETSRGPLPEGVKYPIFSEEQTPKRTEREISEDASYWNFTKANVGSLAPLIGSGVSSIVTMHDRLAAQNLQLGQLFLERIASEYQDDKVGNDAKDIIEKAAEKYGMDVGEYAKYTANVVDAAFRTEMDSLEEFSKIMQEVQKYKPKSADDTFLGHIAALAIENIQNVAYIAAGVITMNPVTTMALMGTDIYARTYAQARLDGRSADQASMDAFASAIIEGVTEGVPVGKFIKLMKAGNTGRAMKMLQGVATEAGQELLAEAAQIAYDIKVIGDDMSWGEALARMRDAGILGGLMGAAIGGPVAVLGDNKMSNANARINESKKKLLSVANRVMDPAKKGTAAGKAEVQAATKEYADAVKAKRALVQERMEAEAEKKKAKGDKKAAKKTKAQPVKKKPAKVEEPVGTLTEEVLDEADTIESVVSGDKITQEAAQRLLDRGLAKETTGGTLVMLPAGNRRLKAVRAAQAQAEADVRAKKAEEQPAPVKPSPAIVKPAKEEAVKNRKAELMKRVEAGIKSPEVRERIVESIVKAEQEEASFEAIETREAARIEKNMNEGYNQALKDQNAVETEVALNLAHLDQKNVSGKFTTRLGDVLREAEKKLRAEAEKAKAEMDMDFWTKPTQGQLFEIGAVMAKGSKEYAKLVKVGALKLATHGAKYSAWAADMIGEFGQSIRPVLTRLYNDAKRNVKNVMRWSHERHAKGPKKGELKHGPKPYAKPGAITGLRRVLAKLADEGKGARFWYEKSGAAIKKATGNDKDARILSGLLAIYSTGTGVGPNLTNALKMWAIYKSGKIPIARQGTIAGRFSRQDKEAVRWMRGQSDAEFTELAGAKVFAFFTNLMREVDPKTYEYGQGVTVDIWMMRAFGYDVQAPTDSQNAFAAVELKALAEKLGWEKQQVQAAVWVSIKSRWGIITDNAQKSAVKKGLAELNPAPKGRVTFDALGATREEQIENEKKIILVFREEAMKASVGELGASLNRSKRDFSDFLESQYATISWEAEPSTSLGLVFNSMPIEDKILLQYEISQVLTNPETGREYLAEWLGLLGADQFQGPGVWDGAVGAVTQNRVLAPLQHKRSEAKHVVKTVQPESASALNGYAAILGFLLKQDAVAWHRPFYGKAKKRANGVSLVMPKNMDAGKLRRAVMKLYSAIVAESSARGFGEYTGLQWAPIVMDGEIRVLNFQDDFVGNREFHKIIEAAAEKSGVGGALETFQSDGNLVTNDWELSPNGETYEQTISNNENKRVGKAFERAKRELAKRIDAVYAKYAEKYAARRRASINVTRAEEGKKLPTLKKGYARFRHFGKKAVATLKTEFFGTGLDRKTKARGRMAVISAYPEKGFKKEVGLGMFEYVIDVRIEDLYDANNDPSGFKEKARDGKRLDFEKFESLIKGAGFVGYYTPKADGNLRGQARFFHDLTVGKASLSATLMVPSKTTIQIIENEMDEFEVRELNGEIYYTQDADDAISTARSIYGDNAIVEVVDEFGDVLITDHPKTKKMTLKLKLEQGAQDAEVTSAIGEFMEEYIEETTENPLVRDERILGTGAAIELGRTGNEIWLNSIRSFDPGTGQGNTALKFLVELANKHGVRLQLYAKPFGSVGMDEQALIRWYEDNGFVRTSPGATTMVRVPQNVTRTFSFWKRPKTLTNAFWGIDIAEAYDVVQKFTDDLGITNVRVMESVEGLPDALYGQIVMNGYATSVQGAFHDDAIDGPTIYVIASNINNVHGKGGLIEVLTHETVGHFGLQAMLGIKKYNQIMDAIIKRVPDSVALRGKSMGPGLQSRRLAAEEVFAYMVQDKLSGKDLTKVELGFIQSVIAEIKLLFVRLGWKQITYEDMLNLMTQSLVFVRRTDTAKLQKRAQRVSDMRQAAINAEKEVAVAMPLALKEDDTLLKSFDDKTGSRKSDALETLREWRNRMFSNMRNRFEIKITDEFSGIRHMEEELDIEGPISGYMSVRLAAGVDVIIRSSLDNAVPVWHIEEDGSASVKMDDSIKGLTEVLADIKSPELLRNFQRYLVANRSRRLIKEGKEHLVTREEIAAVLKDVRKQGQYKLFVQVQKNLDAYKSKILDFAQEAGLIDPVSRKLWEKHDHVPFYRVLAKHDKNGAFAKLGSVGKIIHHQKGSTADLKPALENIFDNISMLIEASVKNRAMSDVINQFKDSGVVTKVPRMEISTALIPMDQIKEMLNEAGVALDKEGNELLSGVQKLMSLVHTREEDNVVSVQVNGKKEFYYVHDAGVMSGMESVGARNLGWVMKILRAPKRMITLIITRFPGFVFANFFRDMMHSFVLIRYGQHMPWDSFIGWGQAIIHSPVFKELMAGGGMFDSGYINTNDPKTTVKAMKQRLMRSGRGNILDSPAKLARLYMRFANGAENAARISIFKKALRATGSRKQALYEARDIMDFSVRGSSPILQFFLETVPFLGARWQGISRTKRGAMQNPMLVGTRGTMIVLATLALYLNNRDRDEYKALLAYDKHMYYHFFDVFEQGDHYRLPKPFEVGAMFSTIPEIGFEFMLSNEPDKGAAASDALLWTLMEQFNMTPAVQFVTPIYELAINKNLFTEAPIENYWETQLDASRRYNDRTNKTIIWLAQNMPEDAPDFMRSPKQLEFLIKRYFATAADYGMGISDRMFFAEGKPTPRLDENYPAISRFAREPFPKFDRYQETMYEVLDRAEVIWQTMLDLKKERTPDARAEYKQIRANNRALLFARKRMTPAYKRIQQLNKRIVLIHANKRTTPDDKRDKLNKIIDQKRRLAERIYNYRPGGSRNPHSGGEQESIIEKLKNLTGMTKREQVNTLISAELPHTATLINDVTIGLDKLREAA